MADYTVSRDGRKVYRKEPTGNLTLVTGPLAMRIRRALVARNERQAAMREDNKERQEAPEWA